MPVNLNVCRLMLCKPLTAIGLVTASSTMANPTYAPYSSEAANSFYNLLFCDEPVAFSVKSGVDPTPWQATLFSTPADIPALEALASDTTQEGRTRYLAFSRLRHLGVSVQPKRLLGAIVEVPLRGGLDTLAAFKIGRAHV